MTDVRSRGGRSPQARRDHAARRRASVDRLKVRILSALEAEPERWWKETELRRRVRTNIALWRAAMTELTDEQRVQVSHPITTREAPGQVVAQYRCPPIRRPERAPTQLKEAHTLILGLLPQRGGLTLGTLVVRLQGKSPMPPHEAEQHILDLYHAGRVELRVTGATQVVKLPGAA